LFNFYIPPTELISSELYLRYLTADLSNAEFRNVIIEGLANNKSFAYKLLCSSGAPGASLIDGTVDSVDLTICSALAADRELVSLELPAPRAKADSFDGNSIDMG
jgi:hypothetical protein